MTETANRITRFCNDSTSCEFIRAGELFQVVVLLHPTKKAAESGDLTEVLVPLTEVIACSDDDAKLAVSPLIPEPKLKFRSRIEFVVRKF